MIERKIANVIAENTVKVTVWRGNTDGERPMKDRLLRRDEERFRINAHRTKIASVGDEKDLDGVESIESDDQQQRPADDKFSTDAHNGSGALWSVQMASHRRSRSWPANV